MAKHLPEIPAFSIERQVARNRFSTGCEAFRRRITEAIENAERGLVDADLGGGVIKQRVARLGQGKSGGYRMLIGFRSKHLAVFLFGFAKSELDNIDDDQLATLREIAAAWFAADDKKISRAITDGLLIEVQHGV